MIALPPIVTRCAAQQRGMVALTTAYAIRVRASAAELLGVVRDLERTGTEFALVREGPQSVSVWRVAAGMQTHQTVHQQRKASFGEVARSRKARR